MLALSARENLAVVVIIRELTRGDGRVARAVRLRRRSDAGVYRVLFAVRQLHQLAVLRADSVPNEQKMADLSEGAQREEHGDEPGQRAQRRVRRAALG